SYSPPFDGALSATRTDTTDSAGRYQFDSLSPGAYNIVAVKNNDKILVNSIVIDSGKKEISDEVLKKTATVLLVTPDSLLDKTGFILAPGTLISKVFDGTSVNVEFDSIPQGTLKKIVFRKTKSDAEIVLFRNVIIDTSDTIMLSPWASWSHSAEITINTAQSGAGVGGNVLNFPVLVRLDSTNFAFRQARRNGEDLRFVKQDNSSLAFEIEYWDSATASASVWVKVDTVYGNNSSQNFRMLWGNSNASSILASKKVFDTAAGFAGVWHLDESGGTTQNDATYNLFSGTPVEMDGACDVTGIIGRAQDFDGSSQCITVLNARNSVLDVQLDSFYTVSVWVYARTINSGLHVILSKGSAQYGFMINKANKWEFYAGLSGYGVDTTTTADASVEKWTLLTGVRNGMKQYLYVNEELSDSTNSARGDIPTVSTHIYDLVIGRQSDDESQWFDGIIDEVRVQNRVQSPDWIKLCYMNQRSDQNMVQVLKKH
ncbi:MAG TPA: hypothetical protein DCO75_09580, partial [Fibrobacteres bacterium]|nr:hypothetical protein [Fibrobacterota bacterium]